MISKLSYAYIYAALIVATIGVALIGYWSLYPYKPIEFKSPQAYPVDKKVYQSGDTIAYTVEYCKKSPMQGTVSRSLVDGIIITYAPLIVDLPVGCRKVTRSDLIIPAFVSSGVYHLEFSIRYDVNPIRHILINNRSVDFEVKQITELDNRVLQHEAEDQIKFDKLLP